MIDDWCQTTGHNCYIISMIFISLTVYIVIRIAQSLVYCIVFYYRSLFVLFSFYFYHCIVCLSSIYDLWLPFGVFKRFFFFFTRIFPNLFSKESKVPIIQHSLHPELIFFYEWSLMTSYKTQLFYPIHDIHHWYKTPAYISSILEVL